MIRSIHPVAGVIALAATVTFWGAAAGAWVLGSETAILWVRTVILWGMLVLVPAVVIAGASGYKLGGAEKRGRIGHKKQRLRFIGINTIVVVLPCAFLLHDLALEAQLGVPYTIEQAIELVAGLLNVVFLLMNARDGRALVAERKAAEGSA